MRAILLFTSFETKPEEEEESLVVKPALAFSSLSEKKRITRGNFSLSLTYRVIRLNKPSRSVNLRRLLRSDDRKLRASSVRIIVSI